MFKHIILLLATMHSYLLLLHRERRPQLFNFIISLSSSTRLFLFQEALVQEDAT